MHTKFYENCFGHSGNIKVITSTILEAVVLALLMGRIYDVCRCDDLRCHDINIPSLMMIGSVIQVIIRMLPQKFESL
jgi:hypothetical protein